MATTDPAEPAYELIWMRPERGTRGPAPSQSRADIVRVAVELADADGIDAVSMRRVAAALGTGTTTLYRYLSRKDDLLELMVDGVMGEIDLPEHPTGDWRADLAALADGIRGVMRDHPWIAAITAARPVLGPNSLHVQELGLGSLDGLGLDIDDMLAVLFTLQSFVRGFVVEELAEAEATRRSGLDRDGWMAAVSPYAGHIVGSGRYPYMVRVMRDADIPHDENRTERVFRFGVDSILAGIATRIDGRSGVGSGS